MPYVFSIALIYKFKKLGYLKIDLLLLLEILVHTNVPTNQS